MKHNLVAQKARDRFWKQTPSTALLQESDFKRWIAMTSKI